MSPCDSGAKPELSVAEVLKVFLPEYLQTHALPVAHLKVFQRLAQCHSGELGWTVWECQDCQKQHWRPNGCGDRHCPSCQHQRSSDWLNKQRQSLLPVRYFHWVFTLPAGLRPIALQNPDAFYGLLLDCASATLLQFGHERFEAEIGITAILHTWGQNLMNHPHVHCLVTGGGLTPQNTWAGSKQARWLFPVNAVSDMFKGKFCAGLLKLHTTGKLQFHGQLKTLAEAAAFTQLLRKVRSPRWNVFAKGSVVGAESVLKYLGRYTHRVALSNGRLLGIDPAARTVSFTCKDYAAGGQTKSITLTGQEFIRRLLLHVLPRGFTKIRHYGLLANNRRKSRVLLAQRALESSPFRFELKSPAPQPATSTPPSNTLTCPYCQSAQLKCLARIDRSGKCTIFGVPGLKNKTPLADSS